MERIPLAVTLLMAGDHLVLVGLRLANPLGLQVAKFLCHFLKLKFADRARKVVELEVTVLLLLPFWAGLTVLPCSSGCLSTSSSDMMWGCSPVFVTHTLHCNCSRADWGLTICFSGKL